MQETHKLHCDFCDKIFEGEIKKTVQKKKSRYQIKSCNMAPKINKAVSGGGVAAFKKARNDDDYTDDVAVTTRKNELQQDS